MWYDPNSTIVQSHDVRVTMRGVRVSETGSPVQVSTRSDFIAPYLSGVRTVDAELDKGLRGWSNYEVKVPAPVNGGVIVGKAERELAQYGAGTVDPATKRTVIIRKAPVQRTGQRKVLATGPNSHYRAMQARSNQLSGC